EVGRAPGGIALPRRRHLRAGGGTAGCLDSGGQRRLTRGRGRRGRRVRGHRRGRGQELVTHEPLDTNGAESADAVSAPGDEDAPTAAADDRLAAVTAERDEYLALAQRVQADFENYRKRAARDQERLVAHAHERLVRELLPVLDGLERTLEAAERHEEAALVDGVRLVERSLRAALAKEGLSEIDTEGAFDPHVHEALL